MINKVPLVIAGCTGRVGRRLCILSLNYSFEIVGAFTSPNNYLLGKPLNNIDPILPSNIIISLPNLNELSIMPRVIIDFSTPEATLNLAKQAEEKNICLVIGTTGLSLDEEKILYDIQVPLIHSMNYSLGMNLLQSLVKQAAKVLGPDFDVEIIETHHNKKKDAPSGSAIALANSIYEGSNGFINKNLYGRHGISNQRTKEEVGIHAIRLGNVIGDHTVMFGAIDEKLELTHQVLNRDVFATGALKVALWLINQTPKRYTFENFLFDIENL